MYVRWLTDSEKYNEWMNPGDYETEAGAAAREAAEAQGCKRKADGDAADGAGGQAAKQAKALDASVSKGKPKGEELAAHSAEMRHGSWSADGAGRLAGRRQNAHRSIRCPKGTPNGGPPLWQQQDDRVPTPEARLRLVPQRQHASCMLG